MHSVQWSGQSPEKRVPNVCWCRNCNSKLNRAHSWQLINLQCHIHFFMTLLICLPRFIDSTSSRYERWPCSSVFNNTNRKYIIPAQMFGIGRHPSKLGQLRCIRPHSWRRYPRDSCLWVLNSRARRKHVNYLLIYYE